MAVPQPADRGSDSIQQGPSGTLRHRVYAILDTGHTAGPLGAFYEGALVALITINVLAATLESVPSFAAVYSAQFDAFEAFSVMVFTIEYLARIWSAPEDPRFGYSAVLGRLHYMVQPLMLVDFLAIAPAYVALFMPFADLRMLRIFRLLRLLKIARYSPALATFGHVIVSERRALFGTLILLLCVMCFTAEAMYLVEGEVQPKIFGTLPDAMWWAIATLTTVGYGDAVPTTALGKIVAGMTMIMGLGLFALPVGIVVTSFINEIHRRDFIVTWSMLARLPLFADLGTDTMGDVLSAVRSQAVNAGSPIASAGDHPEAMYFILTGEAEADHPEGSRRLGPGDYFGHPELLNSKPHATTVKASTFSRLLVLAAEDFTALLNKHPKLRDRIHRAAKKADRA
jgi:voltage-gated potassium channel